jgi:ATP-dependent RNA helicase DDX24/MAK5
MNELFIFLYIEIYRFQSYDCGLLIATDVAARGLDIPCIEHVIHYQVPRTSEVMFN